MEDLQSPDPSSNRQNEFADSSEADDQQSSSSLLPRTRSSPRALAFIAAFCLLLIPLYFVARDIESYAPWMGPFYQSRYPPSKTKILLVESDPDQVVVQSDRLHSVDIRTEEIDSIPIPDRTKRFLGITKSGLFAFATRPKEPDPTGDIKEEILLVDTHGVQATFESKGMMCHLVGGRYLVESTFSRFDVYAPANRGEFQSKLNWLDLERDAVWKSADRNFGGGYVYQAVPNSDFAVLAPRTNRPFKSKWICIEMTPHGPRFCSIWTNGTNATQYFFDGLVALDQRPGKNTLEVRELATGDLVDSIPIPKMFINLLYGDERTLCVGTEIYLANRSTGQTRLESQSGVNQRVKRLSDTTLFRASWNEERTNRAYTIESMDDAAVPLDTNSLYDIVLLENARIVGVDQFGFVKVFDSSTGKIVREFGLHTRTRLLAATTLIGMLVWFLVWRRFFRNHSLPVWVGPLPFFVASAFFVGVNLETQRLTSIWGFDPLTLHWQVIAALGTSFIFYSVHSSFRSQQRPVIALLPVTGALAAVCAAAYFYWSIHNSGLVFRGIDRNFQESLIRYSMFTGLLLIPYLYSKSAALLRQRVPLFKLTDLFIATGVIAAVYAVLIQFDHNNWKEARSLDNLSNAIAHAGLVAGIALVCVALANTRLGNARLLRWISVPVIMATAALGTYVGSANNLGFNALGAAIPFGVIMPFWTTFSISFLLFLGIVFWLTNPLQVNGKTRKEAA